MPAKFDERLYSLIRGLGGVNGVVGNRVYHVEAIQGSGEPLSKYPCVVYQMYSDRAVGALAGKSGLRTAGFNFMVFSKVTADIRGIAAAIDAIQQSVPVCEANGFEWLEITDVTDEFVVPFEYDEKAMKYTVLDVTVIYREE